ncbi:hypothetical protein C2S52_022655 [Perilla frutescens var. hirtella]|nr:hypothetical protein C2S52_022655 [Perilla frutescens var. hirtella]
MEEIKYPNGVIVLRLFVHCEGCGIEVLKCLRGFEGVEGVEMDAKNQKVIVHGENADPIKVAERLRKKTGKFVEIIHPVPAKAEKEKKKVEPRKVIEVVLKINMHCEGCAKEVKRCIYDMEGVQTVDVEMEKNVVKVKGNMDPQKLVEFISKKCGRSAEILKQSESVENGGGREGDCCCSCASQQVYAPQLFSDENPNSCYVM